MSFWQRTLERAEQLAPGRDAIRLTNLAITAAASEPHRPHGSRLRHIIEHIAVAGPVDTADSLLDWQSLADDANTAALDLTGLDGHDRWVQAFQAADPARKSRGAYATPTTLAAPMARLLLAGGDTPKRIVDPSVGGGTLLLAAAHQLASRRPSRAQLAGAVLRLHGVEFDPVARELCCLQLWLAAAGAVPISQIAEQIHHDNAITRAWTDQDPYDALIMNPPWDSLRHADDVDDHERRRTIHRLENAHTTTDELPPLYTHQGRGDRNLYKAFLELAPHLVTDHAKVVALVPGAWSSDLGTRELRDLYLTHTGVEQWTSFENRERYFPIDGRYKFGILAARLGATGINTLRTLGMADHISRLNAEHVEIAPSDLQAIGGPARLIPDLVDQAEARLLAKILGNGRPLFDPAGPLGTVDYDRELDLTEDLKRGRFERLENLEVTRTDPSTWATRDGQALKPLVEGRMVGQYDPIEKSWVAGRGRTAEWRYNNGHRLADCQPQYLAPACQARRERIAICDVTSATNRRTVLATWVPHTWPCGNTAPVLVFDSEQRALAGLAILNSTVFDWQARRVVAGLHLNRFYLEAMSWPQLDENAVDQLAARARELLALQPRVRDVAPEGMLDTPADVDYVAAHAATERLVADGYGLDRADLERILDPDPTVRRGFWRHYAADPNATLIAEALTDAPATVGA